MNWARISTWSAERFQSLTGIPLKSQSFLFEHGHRYNLASSLSDISQGMFVTVNRICIVCFSPPVCRPIRNLCWSPCCRALTKHQPSSVTTRNTTQTPQSSLWFACLKRNSPRLKQLVSTKSSNCSPALPATQW